MAWTIAGGCGIPSHSQHWCQGSNNRYSTIPCNDCGRNVHTANVGYYFCASCQIMSCTSCAARKQQADAAAPSRFRGTTSPGKQTSLPKKTMIFSATKSTPKTPWKTNSDTSEDDLEINEIWETDSDTSEHDLEVNETWQTNSSYNAAREKKRPVVSSVEAKAWTIPGGCGTPSHSQYWCQGSNNPYITIPCNDCGQNVFTANVGYYFCASCQIMSCTSCAARKEQTVTAAPSRSRGTTSPGKQTSLPKKTMIFSAIKSTPKTPWKTNSDTSEDDLEINEIWETDSGTSEHDLEVNEIWETDSGTSEHDLEVNEIWETDSGTSEHDLEVNETCQTNSSYNAAREKKPAIVSSVDATAWTIPGGCGTPSHSQHWCLGGRYKYCHDCGRHVYTANVGYFLCATCQFMSCTSCAARKQQAVTATPSRSRGTKLWGKQRRLPKKTMTKSTPETPWKTNSDTSEACQTNSIFIAAREKKPATVSSVEVAWTIPGGCGTPSHSQVWLLGGAPIDCHDCARFVDTADVGYYFCPSCQIMSCTSCAARKQQTVTATQSQSRASPSQQRTAPPVKRTMGADLMEFNDHSDDEGVGALFQTVLDSLEGIDNQDNTEKLNQLSTLVNNFQINTEAAAASSLARQPSVSSQVHSKISTLGQSETHEPASMSPVQTQLDAGKEERRRAKQAAKEQKEQEEAAARALQEQMKAARREEKANRAAEATRQLQSMFHQALQRIESQKHSGSSNDASSAKELADMRALTANLQASDAKRHEEITKLHEEITKQLLDLGRLSQDRHQEQTKLHRETQAQRYQMQNTQPSGSIEAAIARNFAELTKLHHDQARLSQDRHQEQTKLHHKTQAQQYQMRNTQSSVSIEATIAQNFAQLTRYQHDQARLHEERHHELTDLHQEQARVTEKRDQEYLSTLQEIIRTQVQSTTRAVPRLVLCTETSSSRKKLLTILRVGLKGVQLHLLCEHAKQPHVVEGAPGCEINQKVAGDRWIKLQPFLAAGLKVLSLAINAAAMYAGIGGVNDVLPKLHKMVWDTSPIDLGKQAVHTRGSGVQEAEAEEAAAQWLLSYLIGQKIDIATTFKLYRVRFTSPEDIRGNVGWLCSDHVELGLKDRSLEHFPTWL